MTFGDFVRECYLQSTPSIDLKEVKEGEFVKSWEHKLAASVYEKLVTEFAGDDKDKIIACALWCLNSGPSLVNDSNNN